MCQVSQVKNGRYLGTERRDDTNAPVQVFTVDYFFPLFDELND
jgi:hypothetical protein